MSESKSSAREFVLVLLGVLLAFGIQSRWEARQERRDEAGYLMALRSELDENRVQLLRVQEVARATLAAADTMRGAWSGAAAVEPGRLPGLIWRATGVSGGKFRSTALESLTRSAAWARLPDPDLQLVLSRLELQLTEARANAEIASTFWFDASEPILREVVSYDEWERAASDPGSVTIDADAWVGLLSDLRFQNLVTHAAWFAGLSVSEAERVVAEIDRALALMGKP